MAKVWGNAKDLLSKSYSEPMQGAKIWMEGEKKIRMGASTTILISAFLLDPKFSSLA